MTKEKLKKYKDTKKELDNIHYRIKELEEKKTSIKSQVINDMPTGNADKDRLGTLLVRIEELLEVYYKKLSELTEQQFEIEIAIDALDNPAERNIMRLRYLDGHKWERICVETNYSWEGIHKVHRKILKKIG